MAEGFSAGELSRRATLLAGTILAVAILTAMVPGHVRTFFHRLALGARHYPTRTEIAELTLGGQPIDVAASAPLVIKCPYGLPLEVQARCAGELPAAGQAEVRGRSGGAELTLALEQQAGDTPGTYAGSLPRLVEPLTISVELGDAWLEPVSVQVIPLPVVETRLIPTLPTYARAAATPTDAAPGARQISVIEGSRVDMELLARNKRLTAAMLSVQGSKHELRPADAERRTWRLDARGTPLESIVAPVRYELQVVDEDGLSLERPIEGFIRIKADQRPRITADVVTRAVLPTATPEVVYRASDDYGIARLLAHVQVTDTEGVQHEPTTLSVRALPEPLVREALPVQDVYPLPLASLKLTKGDQLKVTLEAIDYRGAAPGQSALSEPIVLQVTDESGVLAAISESDERSAQQLDAIIKRQLGIGDSK